MKSTLYTRSITPEQKLSKNKELSKKLANTRKSPTYNEKQQIAFLNKEIFSNPQRLANYNLKPNTQEKIVKINTTLNIKNVNPSKNFKPNIKTNTNSQIKHPNKSNTTEKSIQEQNTLFKYLLNNTPNHKKESSSVESKEIPFNNEEIDQKTEPKRTKFIDSIQESFKDSPNNKTYEHILEQIKEEKKVFYERLNNITNKSRDNNFQTALNDSINSNSFMRNKLPQSALEHVPHQILNSFEIEKATLIKLLEELENNKRGKEADLMSLNEKLQKQDQELKEMQKNHSEIKENLTFNIDELKNENHALESQIEKVKNNINEQEKSYKETENLIENYKQEILHMNCSFEKKEKNYEKEVYLLEFQISNETAHNIELNQKLEALNVSVKNNAGLKEQYEILKKELKAKNEEIVQLESKKSQILMKQNEIRINSQDSIFHLKEEVIRKTQELHQMKTEFNEFCKTKEKEKENLENEIILMESELKILQITKEQEQKHMQDRLNKTIKENELLETELKNFEIEQEKKIKEIQQELEDLENKSNKVEKEIKDLDEIKRNLQEELNSTKQIFDNQKNQVEKEIQNIEEENENLNQALQTMIKENFELEKELGEEKKKVEGSFENEINKLNKEIDDYKYLIENLTKSKEDLEKELENLNKKMNEEKTKKNELGTQEKDKTKIITKLKNELQDLQKINEENNNLLKKMLEEKEQNEKELNDLNMLSSVFQKEMERNLDTINEMNQKEGQLNNKIKTLEAELKKKKQRIKENSNFNIAESKNKVEEFENNQIPVIISNSKEIETQKKNVIANETKKRIIKEEIQKNASVKPRKLINSPKYASVIKSLENIFQSNPEQKEELTTIPEIEEVNNIMCHFRMDDKLPIRKKKKKNNQINFNFD